MEQYASDEPEGKSRTRQDILFETKYTEKVAPIMRNVEPISEEHFRLIYRWMEKNMFEIENDASTAK